MKPQIAVSVSQEKRDAMRILITQIKSQGLNEMSFHEKKSFLQKLISVTKDMTNEQEKAYEEAIRQLEENSSASVLLDLDVVNLIHDGIDLQARIMESYQQERGYIMNNNIKVGVLTASTGPITDITTNVMPVLVAAIAASKVLNGTNTTPAGEDVIQSTVARHVVFAEIKNYLDNHEELSGKYQVTSNFTFEW